MNITIWLPEQAWKTMWTVRFRKCRQSNLKRQNFWKKWIRHTVERTVSDGSLIHGWWSFYSICRKWLWLQLIYIVQIHIFRFFYCWLQFLQVSSYTCRKRSLAHRRNRSRIHSEKSIFITHSCLGYAISSKRKCVVMNQCLWDMRRNASVKRQQKNISTGGRKIILKNWKKVSRLQAILSYLQYWYGVQNKIWSRLAHLPLWWHS